jgi:exopolysaccharide production protein ExoZ
MARERIVSLQILRFAAAAAVTVAHASCATEFWKHSGCIAQYPAGVGAAGVDVFFVLSGFVIAMNGPLAEPRPTAVTFFWRRWSRVAPIYYLLSLPLIVHALVHGWFNLPQAIATFLFWPAAGPSIVLPFVEAGWTLCFEMVFYSAISAVLIDGRVRRNLAGLGLVFAALLAARQFSGWNPLRILANPIFLEFAAGVVLARLWPRLKSADLRLGAALMIAGLALFAVDAVVGAGDAISLESTLRDTDAFWRVGVFGVPALLLVAGACICERAMHGRVARMLAWMGDASYSTYLIQGTAIPVVALSLFPFLGTHRPAALACALIFVSLALGAATYVLIERPILRDLRRLKLPAAWRQPRSTPLRT